jgi:hypothetical protein
MAYLSRRNVVRVKRRDAKTAIIAAALPPKESCVFAAQW